MDSTKKHNLLLALLIILALIYFFTGTNNAEKPNFASASIVRTLDNETHMAENYWELKKRNYRPNAAKELAKLTPSSLGLLAKAPSDFERNEALQERLKLRAFSGSPPFVPHPISEQNTDECIVCHQYGVVVGEKYAPPMSHQMFTNCIQCHVQESRTSPEKSPQITAPNSFAGWVTWGNGEIAMKGTAPIIPHPTWMRKNCSSCHGVFGKIGLKTPHPQRTNCKQCHIGMADQP